jgi:hypothetical protein
MTMTKPNDATMTTASLAETSEQAKRALETLAVATSRVAEARKTLTDARKLDAETLLMRRGHSGKQGAAREDFLARDRFEPFVGVVVHENGERWLVVPEDTAAHAHRREQAAESVEQARVRYEEEWAAYLDASRVWSELRLALQTERSEQLTREQGDRAAAQMADATKQTALVRKYTLALVIVGALQVVAGLLQACAGFRH